MLYDMCSSSQLAESPGVELCFRCYNVFSGRRPLLHACMEELTSGCRTACMHSARPGAVPLTLYFVTVRVDMPPLETWGF